MFKSYDYFQYEICMSDFHECYNSFLPSPIPEDAVLHFAFPL